MKHCSSCNKEVTTGFVEYKSPSGKTHIVRCFECRKSARPYTDPQTGFVGP